jgi:hypothetical protein
MDPAIPALLSEAFLSALNPYLLQAEIAAAVLLGIGIVYESNKYPTSVHESAFWFVVIGVVLETIFSVLLFASEERIGSLQRDTIEAQNTQIIALENRLAPRILSADAQREIVGKIKDITGISFAVAINPASEPISFALQLGGTLENVWTWAPFHPASGISTSFNDKPPMFENQSMRGLLIAVPDEAGENLKLEMAASVSRDVIRSSTGFNVDKIRIRLAPMQDTLGILVGTKE